MSVSDILSRTPSNIASSNVQQLSNDFRKAGQRTLDNSKYDSRASFQEAGFDREYDKLQGILSRVNVYGTTTTLSESQLTTKQAALQDIRKIVADFKGDTSQEVIFGEGTTKDVNEALNKIATVLNRKVDGKYVFGGKNNNQPPVQIDITTLSSQNLDTFTNVNQAANLVQVSDSLTVDINMVTAKDVQPLIAALIMYKSAGGIENAQQIQLAFDGALKSQGLLETNVATALNQVTAAKAENNVSSVAAQKEIDDNFTIDIVTQADNLGGAMRSLLTNFKINAATSSVLNNLMNSTSI